MNKAVVVVVVVVLKSCVELLRSCGISNLVAVSENPAFCLDYKLPTTLNIRTYNTMYM